MFNKSFFIGLFIYFIFIIIFFLYRPKSKLHKLTLESSNKKENVIKVVGTIIILLILILSSAYLMKLDPIWNGKIPAHRNQYELIAQAFRNGHLYFDYEVDSKLLELDNPYDLGVRVASGAEYHHDHAFYNGHYYMYFGVVPVLLLFLPYLIITGTSLVTYHATQIFVAMYIIGAFSLFYTIAKKFFKEMPIGLYWILSSALVIMSIWYTVEAPALYCTAISAGFCMEIWSLFFFFRAVYIEENENKSIVLAFFGSLFGALAFGCRPPIALANILVLPMLIEFLRKRKINLKLIGKLVIAALPYIIIGGLLMAYNYVRFDSVFEFGQSYQLTVTDQTSYGNFLDNFDLIKVINGVLSNLISFNNLDNVFPYVSFSGALINFPILLFSIIGICNEKVRDKLKEMHLLPFVLVLFLVPIIISIFDILWSPYILERYRSDIYWILGLLCFIIIGFYYSILDDKRKCKFSYIMFLLSIFTICVSFLLFIKPNDANITAYSPEILETIKNVLKLGLH